MAGPFRGDVKKMKKKSGGKTSRSLVARSRKLRGDDAKSYIGSLIDGECVGDGASAASAASGFLSQATPKEGSTMKRKPLVIVKGDGNTEVAAEVVVHGSRSSTEAQGLKLLHRAIKEQSHNRVLPHQERPDYEYQLRRMATLGVVRLFNSLAEAQKVGAATLEEAEKTLTLDKAQEKKVVASRDAFLAALRQPEP